MRKLYNTALILGLGAMLAPGQEPKYPQVRVPVQMVVTVEPVLGGIAPELMREDVVAMQGDVRIPIAKWDPLRSYLSRLDLFILIDESSSANLGGKLGELREFVNTQPASTFIGVAYMRNGVVSMAQDPTPNHAVAAAALRLPMGNGGALDSPYWALNDLVKRWMPSGGRRAILMVTSGIDSFGSFVPSSPCVDRDIEGAQRAGIQVYALYTPGRGPVAMNTWRINFGQTFLSKIAEETGGEAYYLGSDPLVSFSPYLTKMTERFKNQYLATFFLAANGKDELRSISFATEIPNAKIVSAAKVRVPAW